MDYADQVANISEGTDVYGSDGDKVGSVVAVQSNSLVIEKGFFIPTDYYIPTSAISSYDDGKVYLNVTKEEALNQGWDTAPADDVVLTEEPAVVSSGDAAMAHQTVDERVDHADDDTLRVQVHEEELTATKTASEIGEVRIEKDVIAEERTLEVPVTEERVRVSRVEVDRPLAASDADAFEEGTIEVPIWGEQVQVQKETRVTGEVEVDKEQVQRTERVAGTVRREEVHVSEDMVDTKVNARKKR